MELLFILDIRDYSVFIIFSNIENVNHELAHPGFYRRNLKNRNGKN